MKKLFLLIPVLMLFTGGCTTDYWAEVTVYDFSKSNTSNQQRQIDFQQCKRDLVVAGRDWKAFAIRDCMVAIGYEFREEKTCWVKPCIVPPPN